MKAKYLAEKKFLSSDEQAGEVLLITFQILDKQLKRLFLIQILVQMLGEDQTGVLMFDGNLRVKQKVTYERIRQHFQDRYDSKLSYGIVV